MALLKDLLVNGVSRLVGDVFLDKLNAPTTSAGVDFGLGTNGLVLKTNGDHIYWDDALTIGYGDTINPYASKTKNYVLAAPNGSNGAPSFRSLVAADLPTVTVAKGGTGMTTATNKNAVVIGNSTTVTNAMQTVRTASGAFYATGQDAKPLFGTLPVAQGGTGVAYSQTTGPAANLVFASDPDPTHTAGNFAAPSFRALTTSDLPDNIIINLFYIQNYGWLGFILPNNSTATDFLYRTFLISTAIIDPNLPRLYLTTATLVNSTNGAKKAYLGIPLNTATGWYSQASMIFNTGTSILNISALNMSNNVFLFSNCLLWVLLDNAYFSHTTYNQMVEIGWYLVSDMNGYPQFTSSYTNNTAIGRVLDKISVPAGYSITLQPNMVSLVWNNTSNTYDALLLKIY